MKTGDIELYKEVRKVKLSTILPKFKFPPGFDHAIVDKDNNILNFCSSRYNLVKNIIVFKPIEDYLKERKIDYIRKVKIINKSKFYVDYIIKQRKDTDSVKGVFPKISIWNSYDGGSIMRYEFGFYRLVCSNGLTVPDRDVTQKSFKHSKIEKIVKGDVINTLMEIKNFIDNSSTIVENFEKLAKIKVTKKKISVIGEQIGLSKKIIQCAEERYDLESNPGIEYLNEHGEVVKHNGSEKNLFLLYNALNYGIYNTNLKELPEKKLEKDKKLMNFLLKDL
jgi:hypothetical protein